MLTVGVEEEFLLLDETGSLAPVAPQVVGDDARVRGEYMTYQIETATAVCSTADDLRSELDGLRERVSARALGAGALLVATGAPPIGDGTTPDVSDEPRFRELARRYPSETQISGTCGCHVHVGVADRDLAVGVLGRLRPWLPLLLALTVNSPIRNGADSGWDSSRYPAQLRWPTFRVPGVWRTAADYDEMLRGLIAQGSAMDSGSVYLLARLSARFPTIEVRVADTCLTADDAVLYAMLVRALVASLIEDVRRGVRADPVPAELISSLLLGAARNGLSERRIPLPDPFASGWSHPCDALLVKLGAALAEAGDESAVRRALARLYRTGTGADRQRALWTRAASWGEFAMGLAAVTAGSAPSLPDGPAVSSV